MQPNILFMLADDLGWMDLSCQGSKFYETPNIDRLFAKGMTFTDAYAACPVCSPTRASILSGKYPARVGVTDWIDTFGNCHPRKGRLIDAPYIDHLPDTETSLAAALREGGYQTWHVGKWHLGGPEYYPENHGFDVNVGGCELGSPARGGFFSPWTIPNLPGEDLPANTYLDDHLTDRAIELIEQRDTNRPFLLDMWYYLVHTPIQAPEALVEKYRAKAKRMGLDRIDPFVDRGPVPCTLEGHTRVMQRTVQSDPVYAAMVEKLDESVGRLIDTLEAQGIADQTVVIFTSDNGGFSTMQEAPTCNAPLAWGKGWMHEGGTREPTVIHWPGLTEPGATCGVPITSPDFYPTLLEVAGLPLRPDQHTDGVSLVPLLKGESGLDRDAIYWHYPHYGNQGGTPAAAIRSGDWKLIRFFEDDRHELYHLGDDIGETRDRTAQEPERAAELRKQLDAWCQACEAKYPAVNPDYQHPSDPEAAPTV